MSPIKGLMAAAALCVLACAAHAQPTQNLAGHTQPPQLDPKALVLLTPDQVQWPKAEPGKAQSVVLTGDPSKPGSLYVIMMKLPPNTGSRPHSHPGDRFVTVLSGTWWVNTGARYQPDKMVPVKPGSFVYHHANEIHYDGTKADPAIIEIVGLGPSGMTPREEK
jgi:quercetin dioxygenase-like cupin family protein